MPEPLGDAGPAGAVDDLRVAPLRRRHRLDDRRRRGRSRARRCSRSARASRPCPGSIPSILVSEPILRTACICSRKSSRVKSPPPTSLAAISAACSRVEGLLGLLDQGEHVAHAEDARGHPVGVEDVEVVELLAVGREHDRLAGDRRDRQRGTAAGVAVELGEHHAVEADAVEERLRRRRPRPGRSSRRRRRGSRRAATASRMSAACCISSASIAEPAGGVDDDDVVQAACGRASIASRATRTGSPTPLPGSGANTGTPARSPTTCSWSTALGRCRSAATSSGVWPCSREPERQLAGERRLAGALQAGEHDHGRRGLGERSRRVSPPRIATSSSLTILMTCCAGFSACETSAPRARSLTRAMNAATTGSATSASSSAMRISRHGGVDVGLGQPALAAQVLEGRGEAVVEGGEHGSVSRSRTAAGTRSGYPSPACPVAQARADAQLQGDGAGPVRRQRRPVAADARRTRRPPPRRGCDTGAERTSTPSGRQRRADRCSRPGRSCARTSSTVAVRLAAGDDVDPRRRPRHRRAAPRPRLLALGQPRGDVERAVQGAAHVLAQPLDRPAHRRTRADVSSTCTAMPPAVCVERRAHGEPVQAQHAGHLRPAGRPVRGDDGDLHAVAAADRRRAPPAGRAGRGRRARSARSGGAGTAWPREQGARPRHQVGDQRRPSSRPGRRAGGQRVGLGQRVQQVQDLGASARPRRPCATVAGSSRSRRVAVSGAAGGGGPASPAPSMSAGPKPSRGARSADAPRRPPRSGRRGQPLPMSCSSAPTSSRSGRSTRRAYAAALDGGLDQVPVDGVAVHGVALRPAAHPFPVGQQPGDQPGLVERLPDGDRRRGPAPSSAEQPSRAARGHGSGSGGHSAASRSHGVRRERQPGLRGRRRGPQHQRRVAAGSASRASTTSPSCSTTPSASGARVRRAAGRPAARTGCARTRAPARPGATSSSSAYATVRPTPPTWRSSASASSRPSRSATASCSCSTSRSAARPVTSCSASRTSSSALPGVVEALRAGSRPPRTRRPPAARPGRAARRGTP